MTSAKGKRRLVIFAVTVVADLTAAERSFALAHHDPLIP